jgi:predicted NBD/HSP70 family sugar kinase
MDKLISGTPSLVRDINEMNILHLIKEYAPISRIEIAKRIGISQMAVSRLVSRLIEKKFVVVDNVGEEIDSKKSRKPVGRQPTSLYLNKNAAYIVGVDLARETTTIAIADLEGDIAFQKSFQTDLRQNPDSMLSAIVEAIHSCLHSLGLSPERIIGIGVVLPGYVDARRGMLRTSSSLKGWDNFQVKDFFESQFDVETLVEGDFKALTLAEYTLGNGNKCSDMVCLCITDAGPVAGIICNGQLIRGITDSSGQIGAMQIGYYIKQKTFYKYSHATDDIVFDQIVTPQALVQSAQNAILQGEDSILRRHLSKEGKMSISSILGAANGGDVLSIQLLEQFADILSLLVIDMINILNSRMLLLYGEMIDDDGIVLKVIRKNVEHHFLRLPAHSISIKPAKLRKDGYLKGAISLVLNALFTAPRLNQDVFQLAAPMRFLDN